MSQSGSGTNALDRGLEAVAAAWQSISRVPESAIWEQSFGAETVSLEKRYRAAPLGPALVVACASFPAWNVYPAVFANLVTGNPVIVKPHPTSVLQMALAVAILRSTLIDLGHPRDLVQLAVDTVASPITSELATHPGIRVIDFTGSARYGAGSSRTPVRHGCTPRRAGSTPSCSTASPTRMRTCERSRALSRCSPLRCARRRRTSTCRRMAWQSPEGD